MRSKMEFSKKLLIISGCITIIVSLVAVWFSIKSLAMDAIVVILPLTWAETGTATAFYYWKSKNDNRAKYAQKFLRDIGSEWGIDAAVRVAEIVLKD